MSANLCSICDSRPSAIKGVCRYCYATGKRPQEAPAPEPKAAAPEAEEAAVEAADEAPKPKPKRRSRKKAV
jgi:hypothetical protein